MNKKAMLAKVVGGVITIGIAIAVGTTIIENISTTANQTQTISKSPIQNVSSSLSPSGEIGNVFIGIFQSMHLIELFIAFMIYKFISDLIGWDKVFNSILNLFKKKRKIKFKISKKQLLWLQIIFGKAKKKPKEAL